MLTYALKRIAYMVPVLAGITIITFLLFNVAGGDPALQKAGRYATPEKIEEIRREMGLNKPLHLQYIDYVSNIVRLDFGRSWSSQQQISSMITDGIGASLSLTIPSFLLVLIISISIALLVVHFRGGLLDRTVMITCLAMMSLSSLVYILYFQYGIAYKLQLFPINGWDPSFFGRWYYLALPILIFVAIQLGTNILYYRTVFLDEIFQDYVRTARAKGLGNRTILFKHVLRNAMVPIVTLMVLQMPFLILGSLLVESFFGIPGLGGIIYQAIANADFPVIKAMTVLSAVLYMCFQLLADIAYALVDPKIQLR
jgi:peptide/nickel transport system permease protein